MLPLAAIASGLLLLHGAGATPASVLLVLRMVVLPPAGSVAPASAGALPLAGLVAPASGLLLLAQVPDCERPAIARSELLLGLLESLPGCFGLFPHSVCVPSLVGQRAAPTVWLKAN